MERINKEEIKKTTINRIVSYIIVAASLVGLAFCISQIVKYVIQVNENATLTRNLENLMQDTNYLREHFDVLKNDDYYSVYIDGDYQYVDNGKDPISIIK